MRRTKKAYLTFLAVAALALLSACSDQAEQEIDFAEDQGEEAVAIDGEFAEFEDERILEEEAEELTNVEITAETTIGQSYVSGEPLLLLVEVSSDRAIEGKLQVTQEGFNVLAEQEVSVPGGSNKKFALSVADSERFWGGEQVRLVTNQGRKTVRTELRRVETTEPVAVFPDVWSDDIDTTVATLASTDVATLFEFDTELLIHGAPALGNFSAVFMTDKDYAELSDDGEKTLLSWIGQGGNLHLDGQASALPDNIVFDKFENASYGLGAIKLQPGKIKGQNHDGYVEPRFSGDNFDRFDERRFDVAQSVEVMALDAGIEALPVGLLTLLAILYIVIAGPVLWLFLKRSNREPLLWVAVPGVALAATVVLGLVGLQLRSQDGGSHSTIVADYGNINHTYSQYLLATPNGGFTGVKLEAGWGQASVTDRFFEDDFAFNEFGERGGGNASPRVKGDELGVELSAGRATLIGAESREQHAPSWEVETSLSDDKITGTIKNVTEYDLRNTFVGVGSEIVEIDSVKAGESADFELDLKSGDQWDAQLAILRQLGTKDDPVDPGLYGSWVADSLENEFSSSIVVAGWTDEASSPLKTVGGRGLNGGRTGFISVQQLEVNNAAISPVTNRVRLLDQSWIGEMREEGGGVDVSKILKDEIRSLQVAPEVAEGPFDEETAEDGVTDTTVFTIPADARFEDEMQDFPDNFPPNVSESQLFTLSIKPHDSADLDTEIALDASSGVLGLDYWIAGKWVASNLGSQADGVDIALAVPDGAFTDGTVYVRFLLSDQRNFDGRAQPTDYPQLRSAKNDEALVSAATNSDNAAETTSETGESDGSNG